MQDKGTDTMVRDLNDRNYFIGDWEVINDQSVFNFEYRAMASLDKLQVNINGSWKR